MTPLHRAAYNGNPEIVDMLVRAGAAVEARREEGDETPLISAAKPGNDPIVHRLLAAGADPNAKSRYTGTALRPMLALCNALTIRYAFERGAKLNFPPAEALSAAAFNPDPGVMAILLDRGYDPKTSYDGRPIITYAAANGNMQVVRLLVKRGVDVNARDKNRRTPIQAALLVATTDPASIVPVIKFLKSKGAK
jgi:ankyrin repeat protein